MAKIYTKSGDAGKTSLIGGKRISKGELRIEAYGTVDELNSWLGLIRDFTENEPRKAFLKTIQNHLFTVGSHLALEGEDAKEMLPPLNDVLIDKLEEEIDRMDEKLPVLKHFILPGGHSHISHVHIARTVCRRAERCVIRLNDEVSEVDFLIIKLLNRLSDYLFVLARLMARELGAEEQKWEH